MSITKKCVMHASEESYELYSGSTRLLFSDPFSNYETRTDEYCLESSQNSLYTLTLKDSYGDSWTAGSWISVAGPYGNVVLKTMMIENREESFTLSFDYPIPMNGEWKLYSSAMTVAEGWNTASFSDNWEMLIQRLARSTSARPSRALTTWRPTRCASTTATASSPT